MQESFSNLKTTRSFLSLLVGVCLMLPGTVRSAEIVPPPGSLDTKKLFGDSAGVYRGIVETVHQKERNGSLRAASLEATVKIERTYKGADQGKISVRLNSHRASLRIGDHVLLFLDQIDESTFTLKKSFPVSPRISFSNDSGLTLLESDLLKGLDDQDVRKVISTFRLLEGLGSISSLEAVKPLTASANATIAAHAHLLMLQDGDTSLIEHMFSTLERIPLDSDAPLLEIGVAVHGLPDNSIKRLAVVHLSRSKHRPLRTEAMYALSEMNDPSTVPSLIPRLDDQSRYVGFLAIKTLARITGKDSESFLPAFGVYDKNPEPYNISWKKWWAAEGKARYQ